jgi:uncharacterized membrane protein YraQ (UPF0718 family)
MKRDEYDGFRVEYMENKADNINSKRNAGRIRLGLVLLLGIALLLQLKLLSVAVPVSYIDTLQVLTTIFLSIVIEAIPFILLGVFVSSLIQVFVSENTVSKFIPKNTFLGILLAACMGIVFPVCECGIVPVVRRLMAKGMPQSMGISFLLAVPIINPVVFASTYFAFGSAKVAILRVVAAFFVSVTVALLLKRYTKVSGLRKTGHTDERYECPRSCSCSNQQQDDKTGTAPAPAQKIMDTLSHAGDEFFQMGKYLIIGAFLAALLQTVMSRDVLLSVGGSPFSATASMMGLGYALSLCSEADAFIAATFVKSFSLPSILAFLVFGPMLDIKQTMMLLSTFKTGLVVRLIVAVTAVVFLTAIAMHVII